MTKFRVAVRRFPPFESAIVKQWQSFAAASGSGLEIEAVAFDLNPLHAALFERGEAASGAWDVAFMPTDWIAAAQQAGIVTDLRPWMQQRPVADFPQGWSPSLLGLQDFAGGIWGMPYHDGPQCLIYRTDLLQDVPQTWEDYHAAARRSIPGGGRRCNPRQRWRRWTSSADLPPTATRCQRTCARSTALPPACASARGAWR